MSKKNFTFSEMLAVTVVFLFGFALLIPVLSGASAAAKAASCTDNLRQLGQSVAKHAAENDDVLLPARILAKENAYHSNRGLNYGTNVTWLYALRNDFGLADAAPAWEIELPSEVKRGILSCPESFMRSQSTLKLTYGMLAYWIGGEFGGGYGIKLPEMATKFSQLRSPEKKGYFCDASSSASDTADPVAEGVSDELNETFWVINSGRRISRARHNGATNFLFADGHSAPVTLEELQKNGACKKGAGIGTASRNHLLGWHGMK